MARKKKVAGGIGIALILIIAVIAIVWLVMDSGDIDYDELCSNARIAVSSAEYNPSFVAKVTLDGIGDTAKDIDGVKLTFSDADGNILEDYVDASLPDSVTITKEVANFDFDPIKVEASVYFVKGNKKNICSESVSKVMKGINECTANGYICMVEPSCLGDVMNLEGCSSGKICCNV